MEGTGIVGAGILESPNLGVKVKVTTFKCKCGMWILDRILLAPGDIVTCPICGAVYHCNDTGLKERT